MIRYISKKTIVIIVTTLLVISAGLIATSLYFQRQQSAQQQTSVDEVPVAGSAMRICNDDILTKANAALVYPADIAELTKVTDIIRKLHHYAYDINCIYIIIQQDILVSNSGDARTHLDILKGLYSESTGYNQIIKDNAQEPRVLDDIVKKLEDGNSKFLQRDDQIKGPTDDPTQN